MRGRQVDDRHISFFIAQQELYRNTSLNLWVSKGLIIPDGVNNYRTLTVATWKTAVVVNFHQL